MLCGSLHRGCRSGRWRGLLLRLRGSREGCRGVRKGGGVRSSGRCKERLGRGGSVDEEASARGHVSASEDHDPLRPAGRGERDPGAQNRGPPQRAAALHRGHAARCGGGQDARGAASARADEGGQTRWRRRHHGHHQGAHPACRLRERFHLGRHAPHFRAGEHARCAAAGQGGEGVQGHRPRRADIGARRANLRALDSQEVGAVVPRQVCASEEHDFA
mmetsp:Transcript_4800/g.10171  ORF Transcript_4800/g.10171 Transcript_4800/m.10171 type:complete len:218 (+) Transcript_4800:132-785(+)